MKLKCTVCSRAVYGAEPINVGKPCSSNGCVGVMEADNYIRMVGDPIFTRDDWRESLYHFMMNEKRSVKSGLVPERLRHGLWYHW